MEGRTKLWNFFLENKWGIQGDVWGAPDMRGGARLTCVGSILAGIKWQPSSPKQRRANIMPAGQSRHFTYPGRAGLQIAAEQARFHQKGKRGQHPSPTTAQLQSQQI